MPHLHLTFLGALQAQLDGVPLTNFHSVKVQGLLAYLALEADCPHPRETLATLFWPLDAEASARSSLRQALYELRKLLGDRDDSATPFLLVTRQTVQFNRASDQTIDHRWGVVHSALAKPAQGLKLVPSLPYSLGTCSGV